MIISFRFFTARWVIVFFLFTAFRKVKRITWLSTNVSNERPNRDFTCLYVTRYSCFTFLVWLHCLGQSSCSISQIIYSSTGISFKLKIMGHHTVFYQCRLIQLSLILSDTVEVSRMALPRKNFIGDIANMPLLIV